MFKFELGFMFSAWTGWLVCVGIVVSVTVFEGIGLKDDVSDDDSFVGDEVIFSVVLFVNDSWTPIVVLTCILGTTVKDESPVGKVVGLVLGAREPNGSWEGFFD